MTTAQIVLSPATVARRARARPEGLAAWVLITRLAVVLASFLLTAAAPAAAEANSPTTRNLQPGQHQVLEHPLDINIVFVGYRKGSGIRDVDVSRMLAALPQEYRPVTRIPRI